MITINKRKTKKDRKSYSISSHSLKLTKTYHYLWKSKTKKSNNKKLYQKMSYSERKDCENQTFNNFNNFFRLIFCILDIFLLLRFVYFLLLWHDIERLNKKTVKL